MSDDYPLAEWLGPVPADNYQPGRGDRSIQRVCLHTMYGSMTDADDRFRDPTSQASAHYGIGMDGRIVQWVKDEDTSYANGDLLSNQECITIEHEDKGNSGDSVRTEALHAASAALIAFKCRQYGIPIDRDHITKHSEELTRRQS